MLGTSSRVVCPVKRIARVLASRIGVTPPVLMRVGIYEEGRVSINPRGVLALRWLSGRVQIGVV